MRLTIFISVFVAINASAAEIEKACFRVEGMTCAACSLTLKAAVTKLNGIASVNSSIKENSAVVEFQPDKTNAGAIRDQINGTGYRASTVECPTVGGRK